MGCSISKTVGGAKVESLLKSTRGDMAAKDRMGLNHNALRVSFNLRERPAYALYTHDFGVRRRGFISPQPFVRNGAVPVLGGGRPALSRYSTKMWQFSSSELSKRLILLEFSSFKLQGLVLHSTFILHALSMSSGVRGLLYPRPPCPLLFPFLSWFFFLFKGRHRLTGKGSWADITVRKKRCIEKVKKKKKMQGKDR